MAQSERIGEQLSCDLSDSGLSRLERGLIPAAEKVESNECLLVETDYEVSAVNKSRYEGMLSGSPWIATLAFALVIGVMVNTVTIAQEAPPAPKLADDAVVEEYEPIESPRPVWPIEAARAGVEGDVVLRLTITEDGTTEDIVVVESSDERLNVGAIEAAEKSVFKPRTVNGEPVAVTGVTRTYRFQFNDITGEDLENSGP